MKRILMLVSLALALNSAPGAYAAAEVSGAPKSEKKAEKKDAAEKKAKKDGKKKKAKKGDKDAALVVAKPELKNGGDSIAYLFGAYQSKGLMPYAQQQLNIDSAHVADFARGIMERVNADAQDKAQTAYYAGLQIGSQIQSMAQGLGKDYYAANPEQSIDAKVLANAIVASLLGQCEVESDSAQQLFNEKMNARREANKEVMYGENRRSGERWLEENKKKEGVITLPSGLQYKVITMGDGEKPSATDKVSVNYEGRLIDGTVFDSSYKRNQPATFQCNQVIKGWTEALQKMPVGSKWEVYIPYNLGYGDREAGAQIKPYSALVFTVELLGIENKAKAQEAAGPASPAVGAKKKPQIRKK